MSCEIEAGWLLSSLIVGGMFGAAVGLFIAVVFAWRESAWRAMRWIDNGHCPAVQGPSSFGLQSTPNIPRHQASDLDN